MRKLFLSFLFVSVVSSGYSQRVNLNFILGTSNYEGDLQSGFFRFSQTGFAIGGGIAYQLSDRFYIRGGATFAHVSADDKKNPKVYFRNLNFKSSIQEFHIAGEYYLFTLEDTRILPYVFGGLAVYHFNPYTKDTLGTTFYLQPLSTEGQGFISGRTPYSLTQFALPFGGGIKYALTDNLRIGIEAGLRKLFTDYLDDVSTNYVDPNLLLTNRGPKALELAFRGAEIDKTFAYPVDNTKRGEPKNKDWYYFTGITLTLRLPSRGEIDDRVKPGKNKYKLNCPKN